VRTSARAARSGVSCLGPRLICILLIASAVVLCGCGRKPPSAFASASGDSTLSVDAERLANAAREADQWFTNGRDAGGTYFSPLTDVNRQTVAKLGFAWQYQLGTNRGLEATPVVVDGLMYAVGNWGRVYSLDAATGRERWTYDPQVDGQWGRYACCDAVNRGLALWKGKIYVGALDGHLHAIDAATGQRLWKVDTLIGRAQHLPYTSPGAPVVAGGVCGNRQCRRGLSGGAWLRQRL
jgi:quinohemoprotein ethanol dehydrogenase